MSSGSKGVKSSKEWKYWNEVSGSQYSDIMGCADVLTLYSASTLMS